MKVVRLSIMVTLAFSASSAAGQSLPATPAQPSFAGAWQGKMNDLPAIDLTISEAGERISGVIIFYMHKRSDPNGPWHVEGQARAPLLLTRVEGKILSFEVEHHKCHGCTELSPNVKFRMELTGPNEARLWNLEDGHAGKDSGPGTKLLRRTDSVAALLVSPSPPTTPAKASFAGTWQGKMNDIAGIDLTINEAAGNVGVALLYFQVGSAQPLRSPHVEGKTLAFEVERRTCNQCEDLISKYRMELTGPNEARLWMLDDQEPNKRSGPEVKMVRRTDSPSWLDTSQHKVHFVIVEYGVRLEVLDWGGTGQPVVLLAGSGNTAHIFDDFAPKLAGFCHVYGITRRGYGASSHPDSGYTEQRLAEDVLQVLNSLKIVAPVLVGHSMAGEELTRLGDEHSDRLAAWCIWTRPVIRRIGPQPGLHGALSETDGRKARPPFTFFSSTAAPLILRGIP